MTQGNPSYQRRIRYLADEDLPGELSEALIQFGNSSKAGMRRLKTLMELLIQRQRLEIQAMPVGSMSNEELSRRVTLLYGVIYGLKLVHDFADDALGDSLTPHNFVDAGFAPVSVSRFGFGEGDDDE